MPGKGVLPGSKRVLATISIVCTWHSCSQSRLTSSMSIYHCHWHVSDHSPPQQYFPCHSCDTAQVRKVDEFTKQKVVDLKKAVKSLQDQARNIKKNDNTQGLIEVTLQC